MQGIAASGIVPGFATEKARLKRNRRAWQPCAGTVQEHSHPQRFSALNGNQAHLAADVVAVVKLCYLGLVVVGIPLQSGNALFNGAAKPGTDLKTILLSAVGKHGGHLG